MTVPEEYRQASRDFESILVEVRDQAMLGTTHRAYTTLEAVLRVFRCRLTVTQGLAFADLLSVGARALFVSHWDCHQPVLPFGPPQEMIVEVMALRHNHNLSTPSAIEDVVTVLRRHMDEIALKDFLESVSPEALRFWRFDIHAE
ncbi:DUF2267 domain-containing protein [Agrobacterium vitis]|uniref:DUF2267 domain-containing protein n=1 Tax=Agrobacterium vitis TaxID=373 RepID=A0A368NW76_AGRVI|nr:DUF2267 domain-containing protein [Agrobacterium vitis]KAA3516223.1 DUF2267 domain-containing protein [Agrobacterium vitis]KAA3525847.1 DUF2267 domain-containing protein [Agrobacterium vitis]MCF1478868.1 DUF2267 domain-containing protein [Agrobacterium vitis]MUZ95564.1 DUF2267 domain-containing protein [Agrobacterium vitis]MVA31279.1 DUF2267 domain-containing protein [Agrobacterium vitis]